MPSNAYQINAQLTNYARGLAQDRASALAKFLAPTVPTGAASGQYKRYSDKNAFQTYDTARAIGGSARRIEFQADDPTFNCKPQALEIGIDDHERELAGVTDPLGLEQAKISTLVSNAVVGHEVKVLAAINAALTAVAGKGVWSDAAIDPIEQLDEQIAAIADDIGMMPNRIAFGLSAWQVFRNHPKVIARQPGAAVIGVTYGQAAQMLLNPGIDIRVGVLSRDTAKFGKSASKANIVGGEVYVFYNSPSPSTFDASFAKTFMTQGGGVDAVRQYRDDRSRSDIYAVDWSEDIQVVSPVCARRLTLS